MNESNLGRSIGETRPEAVPGSQVTGLGADGKTLVLGGTSVAAPFVTGTRSRSCGRNLPPLAWIPMEGKPANKSA